MTTVEILLSLTGVKKAGDGWNAICPAHDDGTPSLSIKENPDGNTLMICRGGCSTKDVCAKIGLKLSDLFANKPQRNGQPRKIVATYDYRDANGKLMFQVCRFEPKDFRQRRLDGNGEWIWNTKGVERVLFRLPEVLAAIKEGLQIFVCAGEKDVLAMVEGGFCATCNHGGEDKSASKWLDTYTETLRGTKAVIVADKDPTGRAHADAVARKVLGTAQTVKVIELPDVDGNHVKDAADYFHAGGTANKLRNIVEAAPEFVAGSEQQLTKSNNGVSEDVCGDYQNDSDEREPPRKSAATRLVNFAGVFAFFHDTQNRAFVRVELNGHVEVWPVNSTSFRNLLAKIFYERSRTAINRNALADAITTLVGRACYDSPEERPFLRVAPHGENILIDLCDPQWRVIEVASAGWRVLAKSPVAFIRTGSMRPLALPHPAEKGSLDPLWELLNVTPGQRPLAAAALLSGFHPYGPYFVTNLVGEQGSAKSCGAKILRSLIDPNENPLRSPPREERDLLVQASNNWCVVIDNLSRLSPWLSDGLCRLSTGGGHSARQLYSDGEEFTLAVKRPVILTGIDDVATRPDLAERALQIELETIPPERRKSERELWRQFEAARPFIFSAILNGLSCALRELPNTQVNSLPRMADAALFAIAGETAFGWPQGTFLSAYSNNLNDGAIASLDAHPIGVAIRRLLDGTPEWSGEPAHLLATLNKAVGDELRKAQSWPSDARALSSCLRRLAPPLRRAGIEVCFGKGKRRQIRLCKDCISPSPASPIPPASTTPDAKDANLQQLHDEKACVKASE